MRHTQIVKENFRNRYNQEPIIVRSPGRINLLGEHIDYNQGIVLPASIDRNIFLGIGKRNDDRIELYSCDYKDSYSTDRNSLQRSEKHWPNYILGVVDQLQSEGYQLGGFNIAFSGDIPEGAGLSSSAALECAATYALSHIFDLSLSPVKIALVSQRAEHEFVGVNCGLMDQFASVFGKQDHVIKLDCQDNSYSYLSFGFPNKTFLLFDTGVKHSLASSEYNLRRKQCDKGLDLIQKHEPLIKSLREVSEPMLIKYVLPYDEISYKRCSYVVAEIARVIEACKYLLDNEPEKFGSKMFECHEGLTGLYNVSCPELDFLVTLAKSERGILGARMMGGGFGGCTINLVDADYADKIIENVSSSYKNKFGISPRPIVVSLAAGTSLAEETEILQGAAVH